MDNNNENLNQKECIFSLAKINKYFLFPFLVPIICTMANYIIILGNFENNAPKINFTFLLSIYSILAYILGGLLYFVSFIRTQAEKAKRRVTIHLQKSRIQLIYKKITPNKNKKKMCGILFLMSLFLSIFINIFAYSYKTIVFEKRLLYLFFISIFSKYILKSQIYRHQILSLSLASIGLIILLIPVLSNIKIDNILIFVINIFSAPIYSLFLVLIKYLTHNYYLPPLLCLLLIGLTSLIITLIGFIIYSLIKFNDFSYIVDNFRISEYNMGIGFYIYAILGLLFTSLLQIFSFLVIDYFSPILLVITEIIDPMISWILTCIQEPESVKNILLKVIGYFIEIVAALIYNEIIICNFCKLNKYTKRCIMERQNKEINDLIISEEGSENENENDISYSSDGVN